MPASCQDIRAALAECLANSDCVMIYRNKAGDCLREPLVDTLPTKCQQLKRGYGECRRGLIDMRKRFRGNKPVATSLEVEAGSDANTGFGGGGDGGQLYAGIGRKKEDGSSGSGNGEGQ